MAMPTQLLIIMGFQLAGEAPVSGCGPADRIANACTISFHPSSVPDFGQVFGGRMAMTSQAPQCDAPEEETLLATNDTAAAAISVDGNAGNNPPFWCV